QERDAQRRVIAEQVRAGDRFVTQLFAGVGGVRNQLADEYLLVGIDRMDDQVEELGNIGLERPAFATGLINDGHGRQIPLEHRTMARAGMGSIARRAGAAPSPSALCVRGIGRIARIFKGGIWISRTQPGILPVVAVSRDSPPKPRFTRCWRRLLHQRAGDGPVSPRFGRGGGPWPPRPFRRQTVSPPP